MMTLSKAAIALRPMRIAKANDLRLYEAIYFPGRPYAGVELILRRMRAFGYWDGEEAQLAGDVGLDVLDGEGDILHTINITRRGFEWLRRTLKFRVDKALA